MQVFKGYQTIHKPFVRSILTLGNFDGLHLGHRQIIESTINLAREKKGTSIVYTFRPHPRCVLFPKEPFELLDTYEEKLELLNQLGIDIVIEEPFDEHFLNLKAEVFFNDVLLKHLSPQAIYVGYDFTFGKNREGNTHLLEDLCKKNGIDFHVLGPYKLGTQVCSSSLIRGSLHRGEIIFANQLLGREFFYKGSVIRGNGRGKKIGFPTANIQIENKVKVKEGVYVSRTVYADHIYGSVTNIGRQPTFNQDINAPIVIESHLFDFNSDIYGESIEVRLVDRLRDEIRFSSVDGLIHQIQKDVKVAKERLKSM